MAYGSTHVSTTVAAMRAQAGNDAVALWPIDDLLMYVRTTIQAHNDLMEELLGDFCEFSTEREWNDWGSTGSQRRMQRLGELGAVRTQRSGVFQQLMGTPLIGFGDAVAWSYDSLEQISQKEWIKDFDSMLDADKVEIITLLQEAIFRNTAYTHVDDLTDNKAMFVKPFANGDTWKYPNGVNGTVISANHNHYVGRIGGAFGKADIVYAIKGLLEHNPGAEVQLYFNNGDIGTVAGFTPEYVPNAPNNVIIAAGNTVNYAVGDAIDYRETYSRRYQFGRFNGASCMSLWWIPQGYMLAKVVLPRKPLRFRVPKGNGSLGSGAPALTYPDGTKVAGPGQLRLISKTGDLYTSERIERKCGISVAPGARTDVHLTDMINAVYAQPAVFIP